MVDRHQVLNFRVPAQAERLTAYRSDSFTGVDFGSA
jgi:hypothetical protein